LRKNLVLLEKVPAWFQPGPEDEIFALTPQACQALEERKIPYRTLPDLGTEERVREREGAYFQEQLDWFHQLDRMLLKHLPELSSGSVPPSFLYGYQLKTLLDNWFIRATECAALLGSAASASRVAFTGAKGVYSQLLPFLCQRQGIPYEENLPSSDPMPAPRYRLLRRLLHSFRRWSWIARGWKEGAPSSLKAGRLTLLFLETNYDLNDLLNSAMRKKHRCLVLEGSRILDLSERGRVVFSILSNHRPRKSWDQLSEELFGTSSPLWNWVRSGWGLPLEELLAPSLKEWVRSELAQMVLLAEEFRSLYRREGVDFVVTSALVSNPHTAAVAACEPEGRPQAVLIAHGDGAEVKPAWDLFELAPYQHYFVPNAEFAEYFERRRSGYSFPTAQIHVGSYRWRGYTRLRKKPGLTLEYQEGRLSLKKNRPPLPVPSGKPIVVIPLCQPETDTRYLNPLGYSETGYYLLQCRLLKVFAEFPDYTFVVKLFPPESAKTSAIAKALAHSGIKNVYASSAPFSSWLPWADRVLLDWPSTPLYETALAGVPFHLLLSIREYTARPAALEKFKGFFTPFSTLEEAEQAVRQFLRSSAPKPPRIQLEGEEIVSQLMGLKKDWILIASPRTLEKTAVSSLHGIRWAYLGTQAATRSVLEAPLGSANRLPLAIDLQKTANCLRKPFLDFVAQVGSCQKDLLSWWSSRFSWKMWTASDLFLLTVYLSLAENWIKEARNNRQSLLLVVEDPWLLRQLRENQTGAKSSVNFLGVKSLRWEKLEAVFAGTARRAKWLCKTLRDCWNQWRVWPKRRLESPQEPSTALFSVPMAGSFQAGREWRDPHLPQAHHWLTEAGFRVFRFSLLDYSGYERELAQRADYFHPLILWATPAGIWRSLKTCWRPRWPEQMEVAGLNVRRLAEREAWLEAGRASLSGYRLFYECLRNRLAKGNWHWLVFFYENQPWEKLAVLCAHERGIRVAGIQTTILSPESLPYLLGKGEESVMPLPDVICTSGPYAYRLLSEWGNPSHRLKPCGALRYPGLAEEATSNGNGALRRVSRSEILVVLPIYPPMAEHLLRALEGAFPDGGASESLRFHIRPHPLCPISPSQVRIPAQILSSQFGNIQEALQRYGLVLFVGSTVGFEAIHLGRPALRYRPDVLPDIDSVYGPAVPVCNDTDLQQKLLQLVREGFSSQQWEVVRSVVSDFFAPPEPRELLELFRSGTRQETVVKYT